MNLNFKKTFLLAIIFSIGLNQQLAATEIETYAPSSLIAGYALANTDSKDTYKLCAIAALALVTLVAERIDSICEQSRSSCVSINQANILNLMAAGFAFGVAKNLIVAGVNKIKNSKAATQTSETDISQVAKTK